MQPPLHLGHNAIGTVERNRDAVLYYVPGHCWMRSGFRVFDVGHKLLDLLEALEGRECASSSVCFRITRHGFEFCVDDHPMKKRLRKQEVKTP